MASIEMLHGRQAKVEAQQKCQLTAAEGGSGSSLLLQEHPSQLVGRCAADRLRW